MFCVVCIVVENHAYECEHNDDIMKPLIFSFTIHHISIIFSSLLWLGMCVCVQCTHVWTLYVCHIVGIYKMVYNTTNIEPRANWFFKISTPTAHIGNESIQANNSFKYDTIYDSVQCQHLWQQAFYTVENTPRILQPALSSCAVRANALHAHLGYKSKSCETTRMFDDVIFVLGYNVLPVRYIDCSAAKVQQ